MVSTTIVNASCSQTKINLFQLSHHDVTWNKRSELIADNTPDWQDNCLGHQHLLSCVVAPARLFVRVTAPVPPRPGKRHHSNGMPILRGELCLLFLVQQRTRGTLSHAFLGFQWIAGITRRSCSSRKTSYGSFFKAQTLYVTKEICWFKTNNNFFWRDRFYFWGTPTLIFLREN